MKNINDLDFEYSSDDSLSKINENDENEDDILFPSKDLDFLYDFKKSKTYSHKTTKIKNKSKSVKATSKASSIQSETIINDSTSDYSHNKNNHDKYDDIKDKNHKESKRLFLELVEYNNSDIKCDFTLFTEDKIGIPQEWQFPLIKKSNNYDEVDSKEKILIKGEEKIIRDLKFLLDIFKTKKGVLEYFPQYKKITFKGLKLK